MHDNINIGNLRKVIQESLKFKLYPAAGCSKAYFLDLFFKEKKKLLWSNLYGKFCLQYLPIGDEHVGLLNIKRSEKSCNE